MSRVLRTASVLAIATAVTALTGASRNGEPTTSLASEERDMRDRLRRGAERRRLLTDQEYQARLKAENDAAAAPYREARRKRTAAKLVQGHWQHREVHGEPT